MKIRNGFVSNSSSSSFIVAFPSKPKNAEDVWKFMFNGTEGEISLEYSEEKSLSHQHIAERVFLDIKNGSAKKATLKSLVEILSTRYIYSPPDGHSIPFYSIPCYRFDEDGGYWYCRADKYWGLDKKMMDEIKRLTIKGKEDEVVFRSQKNQLEENSGIKWVSYATNGMNPITKNPYTETQIKEYQKYMDDLCALHHTKEYKKIENARVKRLRMKIKKVRDLEEKLATKDAKMFIKDNKDKFIFTVSYSDDSGDAIMEHGDIFRNVPNIIVSNH